MCPSGKSFHEDLCPLIPACVAVLIAFLFLLVFESISPRCAPSGTTGDVNTHPASGTSHI